jgi:uncharacterized protein DUF4105
MAESTSPGPTTQSCRTSAWRWVGRVLCWGTLVLANAWAVMALAVDVRVSWLRTPLAGLLVAVLVGAVIHGRAARWVWTVAFVLVLAWWLLALRPSNDRDWLPDVAVLPYAKINGDQVTIHNVRNCDYRTDTDYTVRHYDRTYDLTALRTVDLYLIHWGSEAIAHTMLSFGFDVGGYVCFSVETRKEKGESYSAFTGFFRQFELTYVVADERDTVRLRTNYQKGQDVYLYRLKAEPSLIRKVFLDYLKTVNSLYARPEWYNALTSNCTTNIRGHTAPYTRGRWSWQILLPGYVDQMAYERGSLDQSLPFDQLKRASWICDKARAADQDPDFSSRIRRGLPGIEPTPPSTVR